MDDVGPMKRVRKLVEEVGCKLQPEQKTHVYSVISGGGKVLLIRTN